MQPKILPAILYSWADQHGYSIDTDEGILAVRDDFITEHYHELYELVYTLCNRHHVMLHSVYGKIPTVSSVPKQRTWIETQRSKASGVVVAGGGFFSQFT